MQSNRAHSIRHLRRKQRGNVATLSMLLIVPMIALIGGGVDVTRAIQVRIELQKAVDSAVLAASSLTNERQMEDTVHDYLRTNLPVGLIDYEDLEVEIDAESDLRGKRVRVETNYSLKTIFLPLVQVTEFDIKVASGGRQDWQQLEVALVLDVSGSMRSSNRIGELRVAAADFIDSVLTEEVEDITSISVVPFASHVRVDDAFLPLVDPAQIDNNKDNNFSDGNRWLGCMDIPLAQYTSTPFAAQSMTPLGEFRDYRMCPDDHNASLFHSNDADDLKDKISGLAPETCPACYTSIDEGALFGLHSLAPGMRGRFTGTFSSERPGDYHSDIQKVLIVMSDGNMSKYYRPRHCWYFSGSCVDYPISNSVAEDKFLELCDEAEANGVMVYTIGFGISSGSKADIVLKACPSIQSNYYLVDNTDIGEAFEAIAANINRVRLFM